MPAVMLNNWCTLSFFLIVGLLKQVTVESTLFDASCSTKLTTDFYGYNISCSFTIIAPQSHTLHYVALNWSLPSQISWKYQGAIVFTGGLDAANAYANNDGIATWGAINASTNATCTMYFSPNISISRNQRELSTVSLYYYNDSDTNTAPLNQIDKIISIQFTLPSNDGPRLDTSSLSLSTKEDHNLDIKIWVTDSDFYQLNENGNIMQLNISVSNGTILFNLINGLYFEIGNSSSSRVISLFGELKYINQSINSITYVPNSNFVGNDVINVFINDLGNSGTGKRKNDSISIDITVTSVWDIPILTVADRYSINEDSTFTMLDVNCSISTDVDKSYIWLKMIIYAIYGNFTFEGDRTNIDIKWESFGLNGINNSISINDTLQVLNSYMINITYHPLTNFNEEMNGIDIIKIVLIDNANLTQSKSFPLTILSVNDAPTIDVVSSFSTNEDTATSFDIIVSDVDSFIQWGAVFVVILSVDHGTLSLRHRNGLYITQGKWKKSGLIQFEGSLTNINSAMKNIIYLPNTNYYGSDVLTINVTDQGNSGVSSNGDWSNVTVDITVNEMGNTPTVPNMMDIYTCMEDVRCYLLPGNISIDNVDIVDNITVEISISDDMALLSIGNESLVTFTVGNGWNDSTLIFYGNISNINTVFNTLSLISTENNHGYYATIDFNITYDKWGKSFIKSCGLRMDAVNDAPYFTLPYMSASTDEDSNLQITDIFITDIDINETWYGKFYVNITCDHCSIDLHNINGITFLSTSSGIPGNNLQFWGRPYAVQLAISTIEYMPDSNFNGEDNITLTVNDDGNTGSGGTQSDTKIISITVNSIVDRPYVICPDESVGASYLWGWEDDNPAVNITGISITDPDNVISPIYLRFTLNHGTVNMTNLAVTTIYSSDESVNEYSWQGMINGSLNEINDNISLINYYPVLNYNRVCCGNELLIIEASYNNSFFDLKEGLDNRFVSSCMIDILIKSVNDAPTIWYENVTIVEDSTNNLLFGLEIDDIDVKEMAGGLLYSSLKNNGFGTFDCDFYAGSWVYNGSRDSSFIAVAGTPSSLRDTMRTCKFTPNDDFSGETEIEVVAWDNGASGDDSISYTVSKIIYVTVNATEDAPKIDWILPIYNESLSIDEDSSLNITFGIWEPDYSPQYHSNLNGSSVTVSSFFGVIKNINGFATNEWIVTENNDSTLTAECYNCTLFSYTEASFEYTPNSHENSELNGNETITFTTQDVNNSGNSETYYLWVNAMNDAINITWDVDHMNHNAYEDIPFSLNISAIDVDSDYSHRNGYILCVIESINGTFYFDFDRSESERFSIIQVSEYNSLNNEGDISSNHSNYSAKVTATHLNQFIKSIRFMSNPDFNGNASLILKVTDLGYGSDINDINNNDNYVWTNETIDLIIHAVNDAPVITWTDVYYIDMIEDEYNFITNVSITDVDSSNECQYTLTVEFLTDIENLAFPNAPYITITEITANKKYQIISNFTVISDAIENISILATSNFNGFIEMRISVVDNDTSIYVDNNNDVTNAIASTPTQTRFLIIHAVNDAPVITTPNTFLTMNEDTCLLLNISVSDVDGYDTRNGYFTGTIISINGTFTLYQYDGLNYIEGNPQNSNLFEFNSHLNSINNALATLEYCGDLNHFGYGSLFFNITDNGYTYSMIASDSTVNNMALNTIETDSVLITFMINETTDEYIISMLEQYNCTEDISQTFSVNISTYDLPNAPNATVTGSSSHGDIYIKDAIINQTLQNGLSQFSLSIENHWIQFTGNYSIIKDALFNLEYRPDLHWNGYDDDLTVLINITNSDVYSIMTSTMYTIAVNDDIAWYIPDFIKITNNFELSVWEDEDLYISDISLNDQDILESDYQLVYINISCFHCKISLKSGLGLYFINGNGSFDNLMVEFKGSFTHVLDAISMITYHPSDNYFGNDTIFFYVSDQSYTTNGLFTEITTNYNTYDTFDVFNITIDVISTPDAPTFNLPSNNQYNPDYFNYGGIYISCNEDASVHIIESSINDIDSDLFEISLFVENGKLSIVNTSVIDNLSFKIGHGTNNSQMIFNGTLIEVNFAIYNISYEPNPDWNGIDTLIIIVTDFMTKAINNEISIQVIAVNDAPIINIDTTNNKNYYQTNEEIPVSIYSGRNAIVIEDIDFYESFDRKGELNVSCNHGKISLGWMEWANHHRFENSGTIFVTTDLNTINNDILPNLVYTPNDDFVGNDNITIIFSDLGHTSGMTNSIDILTDEATILVNVTAINHAPTLTLSTDMIDMTEEFLGSFSIVINDTDCLKSYFDCNLTINIEISNLIPFKSSIFPTNCGYISNNEWVSQISIENSANITEMNQCLSNISIAFDGNDINGIFRNIIEITLNDGYGDIVEATVSINVSNVNDIMYVDSSQDNFEVKQGYSIPINSLQIIDKDFNQTSDTLLSVNITSMNRNMLSLYYLNGIHFTSNDFLFQFDNRYSQLLFSSTMSNLNKALHYLYFHANDSFCGNDTIIVNVDPNNEALNHLLHVNVSCT